MEISSALESDIRDIQRKLAKAIENHQSVALKLKDDPASETDIKCELSKIQKQIIELNDKQKVLLQQLRKEIEENMTNEKLPVYNFNLYKIKPGQLESKKRRRKDLSLTPKYVTSCRPREPSLSPSPTPSSSSSMSDDSMDYDLAPYMLPVPVPKPRPKLLPDMKENLYLGAVTRRDLRPPKIKKSQKVLSDEEVFKDIPMYYDPLPSPPPTDEKDIKARFMTALQLIPKEMLHEMQNKKSERKRRSTATNNPNFVYNNNWEVPMWKRSRTYLSPHKLGKVENVIKKSPKGDEGSDNRKEVKKEKESDVADAKQFLFDNIKLPPGLTVEKVDGNGKSRNSTPDSNTSANMLCFICRTSGLVSVCKECSTCYHLSCISPGSPICCPNCKNKRSTDDNSSEDSGKEEFATKCPNVAESYNKLKEYIESHADPDFSTLISERENFKTELIIKNQELYTEKEKLEERAAELSEALLVQEESKSKLLKQEQLLLGKIKIITDFVTLYQKTNKKNKPEEPEPEGDTEETFKMDENSSKPENTEIRDSCQSVEPPESFETCDSLSEDKSNPVPTPEEPDKNNLENNRNEDNFENYLSPAASSEKSLANSLNNYDSSFSLSQENATSESVRNDKNGESCKSPSPSSKGSILNGKDIDEKSDRSQSPSSKESMPNHLFELEKNEDQMMSQGIENPLKFVFLDEECELSSDNDYENRF